MTSKLKFELQERHHGQVFLKTPLPLSNLSDVPQSPLEGLPLWLQIFPLDRLPPSRSPMMSPHPAANLPSSPQFKHVSGTSSVLSLPFSEVVL